jgi:ubiquinone/menaquinone biosynthesis C-methylase UbiE
MESLISYFDEIAPIWDNANVYNKTYIRDIIKFSEMKDGDNVLDVGSGTGILVDFIREINKSGKIVEIDIQRTENVRRWWPFLRDRRIDEYGDIVKRFRD